MGYQKRHTTCLFYFQMVCGIMLITGLLFGMIINAIAGDTERVQFTALLLTFYTIFILCAMFSFRYLEIKSMDADNSLLIRFGPLQLCCCCQKIKIENSNIKHYSFKKCTIVDRRGAVLSCCKNTLYLNGAGYPKCYDMCCDIITDTTCSDWCCDKCCCCCDDECGKMCMETDLVELKLKEKRKCCCYFNIDTVIASTTDKDGLQEHLKSI
eukprot:UN09156